MNKKDVCKFIGCNPLVSTKILNCILTRRETAKTKYDKHPKCRIKPLTENELARIHFQLTLDGRRQE